MLKECTRLQGRHFNTTFLQEKLQGEFYSTFLCAFALVLIKQRQNMILYLRNYALFQRKTFRGSHFCLYNLVNCLYNCVLVCTSAFLVEFL